MTDIEILTAHFTADYAALHATAMNNAKRDMNLLIDALHAIRNDRLDVADEFVDRAISHLQTSIIDLRTTTVPSLPDWETY